jgi:hypothetical protein
LSPFTGSFSASWHRAAFAFVTAKYQRAICGNMLKELLASAIVLPFVRPKKVTNAAAIDRANATEIVPDAVPALAKTTDIAVWEFANAMMEYAAGDSVKVCWLKLSYDKLAKEKGWPPLSIKALSSRLVDLGCRRIQLDMRATGGGRPMAIEFPLVFGAKVKDLPKVPAQPPVKKVFARDDLLHSEVLAAVRYDAETGEFSCRYSGQPIASTRRNGYIVIRILGGTYPAHRVAWLYSYGRWPRGNIDHADGNPSNNRLANLRECNQSQNMANSRLSSNNTSGVKGVTFEKSVGKYRARIRVRGKMISLGLHETLDQAAAAYEQAARRYFGEFAKPDRRKK